VLSSLVRDKFGLAFKDQCSANTLPKNLEIRRYTATGHSFEMLFLPHPMTSYWKNEPIWAAVKRLYSNE
jgi:hypothetical protein